MEFLLQQKADVNTIGLKGMQPLHIAARNGHVTTVLKEIKDEYDKADRQVATTEASSSTATALAETQGAARAK